MKPFTFATIFYSFSLTALGLDTIIENSLSSLGIKDEPKLIKDSNISASPIAADGSGDSNLAALYDSNHGTSSNKDTGKSGAKLSSGAEANAPAKPLANAPASAPANSPSTQVLVVWINNGGGQAVQSVNQPLMAAGATHKVVVGGATGLIFEPEQVTAAVGDMVVFQFMSNNHTATQSSFDNPCQPLAQGMDSGFLPNPKDTVSPAPEMAMQVVGTNPMWFYCKQGNHCQKGMTFSVNPGPSGSGKTQADFKQKAMSTAPPTGATPPVAAEPPKDKPKDQPKKDPQPPPPPPMNAPPPVLAPGTGNGGAGCSCSCLCGVSNFPSMGSQGIGSFGGLPGALPMSAMQG